MRVLVLGNSGSGKSHCARALAASHALAHLDLDTIVWQPGRIAVARAAGDVAHDVRAFIDANERWVVEGCYGDVIEAALGDCSELVFMNPGREVCLANNRKRPWEAHKYASPEAQLSMLPFLLDWVGLYYSRDDSCSYIVHRRVFDGFSGHKREVLNP
ncbi:adenylate kinase family enzyme [Janthinobacterium sp. CG_23.3]|uniref:adenylate kinase n=1 Tax=Janthinobacterium sp. CG_23.3 TaxID=3349634 RepID=UPI0038D451E8